MEKNEIKKRICSVIVGIRFEKSFRVSDVSGKIIDDILYSKISPFNAEFFPSVRSNDLEKTLINDKTKDYLRIDTENIIFKKSVDKDFDKQFVWVRDVVFPFFENIFKNNNINNILRIGMVVELLLDKNSKILELAKNLDSKFDGINTTRLSFSKKYPTDFGLTSEEKKDFKNAIYSFESRDAELAAVFDYQYFFEPSMDELQDCDIKNMSDKFKLFLEGDYYNTISSLYDQKKK
jgi:hypothetical protein